LLAFVYLFSMRGLVCILHIVHLCTYITLNKTTTQTKTDDADPHPSPVPLNTKPPPTTKPNQQMMLTLATPASALRYQRTLEAWAGPQLVQQAMAAGNGGGECFWFGVVAVYFF
jgi:hypothetical protein